MRICEKKKQISYAVIVQLIDAFVFATWIVRSLFYVNPKFQASGRLMFCVRPGQKP